MTDEASGMHLVILRMHGLFKGSVPVAGLLHTITANAARSGKRDSNIEGARKRMTAVVLWLACWLRLGCYGRSVQGMRVREIVYIHSTARGLSGKASRSS
jgi:hypothetical protein